jgi:hypothetical protein
MSDSWPGGNGTPAHDADPGGRAERPSDRLPEPARRALAALLTSRYVSRARHRAAWEAILAYQDELEGRLDDMYLDLVVDTEAETAFKRQQDGDDVPRVLRRDKPLSRDAWLVLIFLRREYSFADPDDGPVVVSRDQVGEFLRAYREEGDGDGARFARRVDAAISALVRPWQLLEQDPAADYLFTIAPVIVPLVGPDEVRRLAEAFRQASGSEPAADQGSAAEDEEGPS